MIDFSNCPQEKMWWLWDEEGCCRLIKSELELNYARMIIAENRLEGYYLTRYMQSDDDIELSEEKFPINHYGVIYPEPADLFNENSICIKILRAGMETRCEELGDDYDE